MNTKFLRFISRTVLLLSVILSGHAQAQSPGGVIGDYRAWLTPENYNGGTWVNIATGRTVGNFGVSSVSNAAAPPKITGFNYHPAAYFEKGANANAYYRLITSGNNSTVRNENVTIFVVYNRDNTYATNYLLSLSGSMGANALAFVSNSNDNLTMYWPGSDRILGATSGSGIAAVTIANNASSSSNSIAFGYIDGVKQSSVGAAYVGPSGVNAPWVIGGSSATSSIGYGFEGNIQEIIVLNANNVDGNNHMPEADVRKINTYLALKYGISLKSTDNYELYDTNGTSLLTLWNRDSAFDQNIFGIGRDDASNLNQVQSCSTADARVTVFVGRLAELNDQNPAFSGSALNNKQFLVFGSDGIRESAISTEAGSQYAGGTSIDQAVAPNGLNVVGAKYKAQLTNATTMQVNFSARGYLYCFVSTSSDFDPSTTIAYPVGDDGFFHDIVINETYKYVRFAGLKAGPGGVSDGLKMWLRADDTSSLTLVPGMNLADYNKSYSIAWDGLDDPSAIQTGVTKWRDTDLKRTTVYSKNSSSNEIRTPVYIPVHYLMNYHPAIDFYTNWSNFSASLNTTEGPMSTGTPVNSTTFMAMNSALRSGNGNNTYLMAFHQPTVLEDTGDHKPGLGIQSQRGDGQPRLRISNTVNINSRLFNPGSTTISSYQFTNVGSSNIPADNIVVGFNMQYGTYGSSRSVDSWYMNGNGYIGGSLYHSRALKGLMSEIVMYEKALSNEERAMVNSYYALKYGLTLRPNSSEYTAARFDYKLSNGTLLWPGLSSPVDSPFRYYNNIAAIIRDDIALLNNTQSHSTEVGSILHVGVAGESLSFDGNSIVGTLNDREAVIWGDNHGKGTTTVSADDVCGDFDYIFNRRWFVNKVTQDNRSISLLIGLQNNANNNLGQEPSTDLAAADLYSTITNGNDFVMIVDDDSTALIPGNVNYGNFKAVIPMTWLNGEHQCGYTLSKEGTYVTFGYKPNMNGCAGDEDAQFTGSKTFSWTQWTSRTNTSSSATGLNLVVNTPVDLGNDIKITETKVAYPAQVRANRGYPRSVNTPARGSLRVQRRGGAFSQDVVVKITFNHPVIPEFSISDLDASSRSFEEVEITGECSGSTYVPTLSYAGRQAQARYKISGNKATVFRTGGVSARNKNGMVNVAFNGGVTSVTIKYRTKGNRVTSSTQEIYITPLTLRSVPPPPTINEDGLSFGKQVKERDITTCDPVDYSFFIGNVNCEPVTVSFSDILPEKMKWEAGSFGLDAVSSDHNPSFNPQIIAAAIGNGEELKIDELVVPGQTTLVLTGTALLEEDASGGQYDNRASILYSIIENNISVLKDRFYSEDRETKDPYTFFNATWKERQDEVKMSATYSNVKYSANDVIEVTYKVTNANDAISDMYLNVNFNEEFTYVPGSFTASQVSGSAGSPAPVLMTQDADDAPNTLSITGDINGDGGFVLPTGVMEIKFKLTAPLLNNLVKELDENDNETDKIVDLEIDYDFTSEMEDPCIITSIRNLQGDKLIPYSLGITHIITNKSQTTKIVK